MTMLSLKVPKHLITLAVLALTLGLTVSAIRAAPAPRSAQPSFVAIDRYVEQQMRELRIPGLALGIVHGDQIVHLTSFGVADPDGRPVTPQTPFGIGSTTKSFTALAIMQLVEAGKIDLDAPVQRYLPAFRVADLDASAQITVRHLLHQTSGISTADGNVDFMRDDAADDTLERRARALQAIQVTQPVGATFQYATPTTTCSDC